MFCTRLSIRLVGLKALSSVTVFIMRRWKLLLLLNTFAMAAFIIFWGRCDLRAGKSGDTRSHLNGSGLDPGSSNDALLKRLGSLEDVVYRRLNGNDAVVNDSSSKSFWSLAEL